MMELDIEIMLIVKSLKYTQTQPSISIHRYICFHTSTSRAARCNREDNKYPANNKTFYFIEYHNCRTRLLPVIDLNQSLDTIIQQLKRSYSIRNRFEKYSKSSNPCTFHMVCPCSNCFQFPKHTITIFSLSSDFILTPIPLPPSHCTCMLPLDPQPLY